MKQQQNLYEAVRSDRNLYSKNLIESQDEIAEMKRKFKIMTRQVSHVTPTPHPLSTHMLTPRSRHAADRAAEGGDPGKGPESRQGALRAHEGGQGKGGAEGSARLTHAQPNSSPHSTAPTGAEGSARRRTEARRQGRGRGGAIQGGGLHAEHDHQRGRRRAVEAAEGVRDCSVRTRRARHPADQAERRARRAVREDQGAAVHTQRGAARVRRARRGHPGAPRRHRRAALRARRAQGERPEHRPAPPRGAPAQPRSAPRAHEGARALSEELDLSRDPRSHTPHPPYMHRCARCRRSSTSR